MGGICPRRRRDGTTVLRANYLGCHPGRREAGQDQFATPACAELDRLSRARTGYLQKRTKAARIEDVRALPDCRPDHPVRECSHGQVGDRGGCAGDRHPFNLCVRYGNMIFISGLPPCGERTTRRKTARGARALKWREPLPPASRGTRVPAPGSTLSSADPFAIDRAVCPAAHLVDAHGFAKPLLDRRLRSSGSAAAARGKTRWCQIQYARCWCACPWGSRVEVPPSRVALQALDNYFKLRGSGIAGRCGAAVVGNDPETHAAFARALEPHASLDDLRALIQRVLPAQ